MLARALTGCLLAGLVVSGCLIDEKAYDASLVLPSTETGEVGAATTETCQQYCDTVQKNCTGEYQMYLNAGDCMRLCALMPGGEELADPNGTNTVACRLRNALLATSEKDAYCPSAGPAGGGRCGDRCEGFCGLREKLCTGVVPDAAADSCRALCPAVHDDVPFRPDPRMTGDSLACRINHVINASQSEADAERHCWHTSIAPDVQMPTAAPCADPPMTPGNCDAYCELVMFSCSDENQVYESEGQCKAVCRTFPLGVASDLGDSPAENTVGCRRYHSYAALSDPVYHCPHAGPPGDGHCGDPMRNSCQSYCRILKYSCSERFYTEYLPGVPTPTSPLPDNPATDELGTCEQTCFDDLVATDLGAGIDSRYSIATAPVIDQTDDTTPLGDRGDVFQCRLYYAVNALSSASGTPDPASCDAAFGAAPCQ
jgi:hypothetical protein